jgi:mannose-6-phosphate isomerase
MTITRLPIDDVLTVTRPWGNFQQFLTNAPASVKIITIAPRQRLSLQQHAQRDELWQVIDGPVEIEVSGTATTATVGDRFWVARGAVHRMGNSGDCAVRVLEVAFGHFDEDDIKRLEDDYQRIPAS